MSLESKFPTHGYVEDNGTMKQADDKPVDGNHVAGSTIKDNGMLLTVNDTLEAQLNVNTSTSSPGNHQILAGGVQAVNPQQRADKSPSHQSPLSTKGYGLKKWRRVKRDIIKDKVSKSELSGSLSTAKAIHLSVGCLKRSDGSFVQPSNMMKNIGVGVASVMQDSSSDSRFGNGVAIASNVDFEKNEDRSSESSTAASAPRVRYDVPAVLEHVWDKNWPNNSGGKGVDSAQKAEGKKDQLESSKRPRGERVKVKEENSHSSVESDSRSSNFFFTQGAFSFTENGDQIKTSMKYEGENNDKAHSSEQHGEEVQTINGKQAAGEIEENPRPTSHDPFVESILALQSVEKALETELHKLREMGKEAGSVHVDANLESSSPVESTSEAGIHDHSSSDQLDPERINTNGLSYLETQVSTLRESVNYLESKLKESTALLEKKELRIAELEASIIGGNLLEGQAQVTVLQQDRSLEIEPEVENLFQLKIEAEVEYLTFSATVNKLRKDLREGIELFIEQNSLAGEQSAALNKLREIGSKAEVIKKQAVDLETYSEVVLGTEEVLQLQKRVCSVSSYFLVQLVLLILVFWLVASQLSPQPVMDVPT